MIKDEEPLTMVELRELVDSQSDWSIARWCSVWLFLVLFARGLGALFIVDIPWLFSYFTQTP